MEVVTNHRISLACLFFHDVGTSEMTLGALPTLSWHIVISMSYVVGNHPIVVAPNVCSYPQCNVNLHVPKDKLGWN